MTNATPIVLGVFFALATGILISVGTALVLPGTAFDGVWHLYESRRAVMMPHRGWLGPGFLVLALAMASASIGCFTRRRWGWRLAIGIFALNGIGDLVQLAIGHVFEGLAGVAAAGLILYWLTRRNVRAAFN